MIARGDVYWVDHSGARGAETRKTRPAVVVSLGDINDLLDTVAVVPLSSGRARDFEVDVPAGLVGDGRPGRLKTHQLRAVDKVRLGKKVGRLPLDVMSSLEKSLLYYLGMARPKPRPPLL